MISDFCLELLIQPKLFVTRLIHHSFSTSLYGLLTFSIAQADWAESRMAGQDSLGWMPPRLLDGISTGIPVSAQWPSSIQLLVFVAGADPIVPDHLGAW